MKDNIKPEDLHSANTKSFCNTQAKGEASMNITQLETEIIKALEINSKVDWSTVDPNEEFKDLKRFVRKCFKEHNEE